MNNLAASADLPRFGVVAGLEPRHHEARQFELEREDVPMRRLDGDDEQDDR